MVRNNELPPVSESTKIIAQFAKTKIQDKGYTVDLIARKLNRAKSYASIRLAGLKTFTIDDIETIAILLGYSSALEFLSGIPR